MKTTSFKSTRLVISLLAAGVIGGAGVTAFHAERAHAAPAPVVTTSVSPSPNLPVALPNFAQIVQRYGPAVVNISVTSSTKVSDDMPMAGHQGSPDPFGNDPFFEFFRQFEQGQGQSQGQRQGGTREVPTRAEGSGFIIDSTKAARVRPVKPAQEVGNLTVIQSGLASGEVVVVDGQSRLVPGAKVNILTSPMDTTQASQ